MALLLQKAILPLWPEMHAGHGLLMNDAIMFHNMAVEIAQRIHVNGWSEWHLYPQGASANVGLLSLLYTLLGSDPAWFIPFNAAAHTTGVLMVYRIGALFVSTVSLTVVLAEVHRQIGLSLLKIVIAAV